MDLLFKTASDHWEWIISAVLVIVWAVRIEQRGIANRRAIALLERDLENHKEADTALRQEIHAKVDKFEQAIWDQFKTVQESLTRLVSDVSWVRGRLGSIDKEAR